MDANSHGPEGDALLSPVRAKPPRPSVERQGAGDGPRRRIGLIGRRSKENVNGVADDLGDRALAFERDLRHSGQVFTQQRGENFGIERLDERGEAGDVGE